jgi:hypothetical protein
MSFGNNTVGVSIAPWQISSPVNPNTNLGGANVVRVNGTPAPTYSAGPDIDASGQSGVRHYLDINAGENVIWQSFTPRCSGDVTFTGYFSSRVSGMVQQGSGNIRILQGAGINGTELAQTSTTVNDGQNWKQVQASVNVTANVTYTFAVKMDNNVNFDEGSVQYVEHCPEFPQPDPCCPPWTTEMLEQSFVYTSTGSISAPYTLTWQPPAILNSQMQAYINYLNTINPSITTITIAFGIHPAGSGASPGPNGAQVGGTQVIGGSAGGTRFVTWTAGGSAPLAPPSGAFFPTSFNLTPGQWYTLGTGIYVTEGQEYFPESCNRCAISFRVQFVPGMATGREGDKRSTGSTPRLEFKPAPVQNSSASPIKR